MSVVTTPSERPVFVATSDRRARWLRYATLLAVALACAWVAAFVIGTIGFGRLPSVSLPLVPRGADKAPAVQKEPAAPARRAVSPRAADRTGLTARRATTAAAITSRRASATARAATASRRSSPAVTRRSRAAVPQTGQPQTQPAATVTPARQGWARDGATANPGQTRHAAAPATRVRHQPPADPPGQTRRQSGQDTTTAPATPVTTPVPPGQQKKAEQPSTDA